MNKYIKGDVVINATEKAYEVIYKRQGFKPYKEVKTEKTVKTEEVVKLKKNTKKKEEADK